MKSFRRRAGISTTLPFALLLGYAATSMAVGPAGDVFHAMPTSRVITPIVEETLPASNPTWNRSATTPCLSDRRKLVQHLNPWTLGVFGVGSQEEVCGTLLQGLAISFLSPAALGGSPSPTVEVAVNASDADRRDHMRAKLNDSGLLRKVTPHFHFGPIDYRIGSKGMKTSFQYGGVVTTALIGYGDTHRVEIGWPSLTGNFKLAYSVEDGISACRLEFKLGLQ